MLRHSLTNGSTYWVYQVVTYIKVYGRPILLQQYFKLRHSHRLNPVPRVEIGTLVSRYDEVNVGVFHIRQPATLAFMPIFG